MTGINKKLIYVFALSGFYPALQDMANAETLLPPKYSVIDRNGVNVASNQLSLSLNDISIGGELGLSHTISSFSSNFVNLDGEFEGFKDNYSGGVMKVIHTKGRPGNPNFMLYVMRVFDIDSAEDFLINTDGTYTALRDNRYTLTAGPNNTFIYIKPDGTEVTFNKYGGDRGHMSQVKYPNGFIVKVHKSTLGISSPINSVTTNTGFQLKYIYEPHSRPLPASKLGATNNPEIIASSINWSTRMPRYIQAINNTVEYCTVTNASCTLSGTWPTVTYNWPDGMPRAMYIGDSEFSVVDPEGRKTSYYHRAIDEYISGLGFGPGERFLPRIVQVKDSTADQVVMNYSYINVSGTIDYGIDQTLNIIESARLNKAWLGDAIWNYQAAKSYDQTYNISNESIGYQSIEVQLNVDYLVPTKIKTWDTTVLRYPSYKNEIILVEKSGGENFRASYTYDSRGNVKKISYGDYYVEAEYPVSCTNRKTCNQANWVSDANGNKTYYTYHPDSGQVATITSPANENGIKSQTRYTYKKLFAKYKISSATTTTSADGIWLLSSESHCTNSNYTGGSCQGGDEVVTQYQYDVGNLLLIGKAVTAEGLTLRTCYRYDVYGNLIGETQPNAGLATCSY